MPRLPIEIIRERLYERIAVRGPDECWQWTLSTHKFGYGQMWDGKRPEATHRLMWEVTHGEIPSGLMVLHTCDNPPCCNPKHLVLGTHDDNMRQARERGRMASGECHGLKLHPGAVASGERHGSRTKPESRARGDRNGSRSHPERVPRGERVKQAKLKAWQIPEIVRRHQNGETLSNLARSFQVSPATIYRAVNRQCWKHVEIGDDSCQESCSSPLA